MVDLLLVVKTHFARAFPKFNLILLENLLKLWGQVFSIITPLLSLSLMSEEFHKTSCIRVSVNPIV